MLNKVYKACLATTIALIPMVTYGALERTSVFFFSASTIITTIIIPLVFALALLFFFWGVAKYIWSAGDAKEEGKKIMVWGVVALFVMSSIWGIVSILRSELGIGPENSIPIPTLG